MRNPAALLLLGSLALGGCQFVGGAATGALATGPVMKLMRNGRWTGSKMITAENGSAGENMSAVKNS